MVDEDSESGLQILGSVTSLNPCLGSIITEELRIMVICIDWEHLLMLVVF